MLVLAFGVFLVVIIFPLLILLLFLLLLRLLVLVILRSLGGASLGFLSPLIFRSGLLWLLLRLLLRFILLGDVLIFFLRLPCC